MGSPDNFSNASKNLLAEQAGQLCSFPGCGHKTSNAKRKWGQAVPIRSAASIGPRFDPDFSLEHAQDLDNGLWCCPAHATLLQQDSPRFTSELLTTWKREAEARSAAQRNNPNQVGPQAKKPGPRMLSHGPLPVPWRLVHRPYTGLVGRSDDMTELHSRLNRCRRVVLTPQPSSVASGGLGKTLMASEYVHRYGRYYPGGVFWLDGRSLEQILDDLELCGLEMGLYSPMEGNSPEGRAREVVDLWEAIPLDRLVVFDNCEDPSLLSAWAPNSRNNHVLITSRNPDWASGQGLVTQRLSPLLRDESIALLHTKVQNLKNDQSNAIALALDDVPLALHLAGLYLVHFREDPVRYLIELSQLPPTPHEQSSAPSPSSMQDAAVARAFTLSLSRLAFNGSAGETARLLLSLLAMLAPGMPIRQDIFTMAQWLAPMQIKTALRLLKNLGFIHVQDSQFYLHRVLHQLCHEVFSHDHLLTAEAFALQGLCTVVEALLDDEKPGLIQKLLPHLRYRGLPLFESNAEGAAILTSHLAEYLGLVDSMEESVKWSRQSLALTEQVHGPNHEATAAQLSVLGELLVEVELVGEAEQLCKRALAIEEAIHGPNSPELLERLSQIGNLLMRQGRADEGIPFLRRSLAISEAVNGPGDLDTAVFMNNLGLLLQDCGVLAEAEVLHRRALMIVESTLGSDHPDVTEYLSNLAGVLQSDKRFGDAEALMRRVISNVEMNYGPEDPIVATWLSDLASLLIEAGRPEKAEPLMRRALAIDEAAYGPDHPITSFRHRGLGYILMKRKQFKKAEKHFKRALAIKEALLGPDHPDLLDDIHNMILCYLEIRQMEKVETMMERVLAISDGANLAHQDHPDGSPDQLDGGS